MPKKPINVNNDNGDVDNDSVTLSVNAADEVTWTNHAPHPVHVVFKNNNSPFAGSHFKIAANGGTADSGPIQNKNADTYKYDVKGTGPRIIINR
jgi:hypothetical protein